VVARRDGGWPNEPHDSAPGMALSKPSKQIKITRLQAAVTPWKHPLLRKRFYKTSHRGVVNRNASSRHQTKPHCGFATRSRKEAGQQEASSYGKIQLLSDRSRQKRVSMKPVSLSEKPTQTALPFLHLSNAPITRRLTPTSDYNLVTSNYDLLRYDRKSDGTHCLLRGNGDDV
jgi:hypothetical protein